MFYSYDLLGRRGAKFALIWQAAFNKKNIKKREYLQVDVPQSCEDILAWIPQRTKGETAAKRMSLYTTSILMHGLTVIHGLHGQYLITDCYELISRGLALRFSLQLDLDPRVTQRANINIPDNVPPLSQTIRNRDHTRTVNFANESESILAGAESGEFFSVHSAFSRPSSDESSERRRSGRPISANAEDVTLREGSLLQPEPNIQIDDFGTDFNFLNTLDGYENEPQTVLSPIGTLAPLQQAAMPDVTPATLGVDDTILASDLEVPGAPEKAAPRSPDITRPLTPVPPLQPMDVDEIFRPLDATGVRVLRVRRGIQFADPQTMLPKSTLKDWMATPYWQTRDREIPKGAAPIFLLSRETEKRNRHNLLNQSQVFHDLASQKLKEIWVLNCVSRPDTAPPSNSPPWGLPVAEIPRYELDEFEIPPPTKRQRISKGGEKDRSLHGIPEEDGDREDVSSFEVARGHGSSIEGRLDTSSLRADETSGRVSDLMGDLSGRLSRLGRPPKDVTLDFPSLMEEPEDQLLQQSDGLDDTIVGLAMVDEREKRQPKKAKRHECAGESDQMSDMPFLRARSARIVVEDFLAIYESETTDYGETKFEFICPLATRNRIEAAKMFSILLALLKKKILVASQQIPFGEILIKNGKNFNREVKGRVLYG